MIRHYLKTAFRELRKNRLSSVIKISGLAVAIMVSISILSWTRHELSYDRFHKDSGSIYRILLRDIGLVSLPPPFKTQVLEKIPEVECSTRLFKSSFLGGKTKVSSGDRVFVDDEIYYADEGFFEVFTFPFIRGDGPTALEKPDAVVITESSAEKYFGDADPIGRTLVSSGTKELEIT
ncbi:MAG TPA: ABC transporter permease, partial [Candidatus Krumholzibacterium sp.]|nr:ABC transporter permease [Candidatus Krumholzibacterium sp.]